MADIEGDHTKKPKDCGAMRGGNWHCQNLKEVSDLRDFDGETYACEVCGERFRLYYEDMT